MRGLLGAVWSASRSRPGLYSAPALDAPDHSRSLASRLPTTVTNFCVLPRKISLKRICPQHRLVPHINPERKITPIMARSVPAGSPNRLVHDWRLKPAPPPHEALAEGSLGRRQRRLFCLSPRFGAAHPVQLDHHRGPISRPQQIAHFSLIPLDMSLTNFPIASTPTAC